MLLRFRYSVSRLLIDFIIPAVIHSDFACLNLINFTFLRDKLFCFALVKTFSIIR